MSRCLCRRALVRLRGRPPEPAAQRVKIGFVSQYYHRRPSYCIISFYNNGLVLFCADRGCLRSLSCSATFVRNWSRLARRMIRPRWMAIQPADERRRTSTAQRSARRSDVNSTRPSSPKSITTRPSAAVTAGVIECGKPHVSEAVCVSAVQIRSRQGIEFDSINAAVTIRALMNSAFQLANGDRYMQQGCSADAATASAMSR